jgi:hypothetical protein
MEWISITLMIVILNFLVTLWLWRGLAIIYGTVNCMHSGLHRVWEDEEGTRTQLHEFFEGLDKDKNHIEVMKWDHDDDSNASE